MGWETGGGVRLDQWVELGLTPDLHAHYVAHPHGHWCDDSQHDFEGGERHSHERVVPMENDIEYRTGDA